MASLSSLPISIEGSAAEGAALCGFKVLATIRSGNSVDFVSPVDRRGRSLRSSSASNDRRWVLGSERLTRSCRSRETTGGSWRIVPLRVSEKDTFQGQEDDKDPDDAIDAAIKKSKNLMAQQSELLQQISERKKIAASIKDSVANPVDEGTSTEESKTSGLDLSSGNKVLSKELGDSSISHKNVASHPGKIPQSSTLVYNTSSSVSSSNTNALDAKYDSGPKSTRNVRSARKVPENSTSVPSGTSSKQDGKLTGSSMLKASSEKIEARPDLSKRHLNEFNERSSTPPKSDPARRSPYYNFGMDDKVSSSPTFKSFRTVAPSRLEGKLEESLGMGKTGETDGPSHEDVKPPPLAGPNVMNVILVAAECSPWKKTGGLGDVAGALPKALSRRGHRVMIVVPRYGDYAEPVDTGIRKRYMVAGQDMEVGYFHTYIDGVDIVFIDNPMFRHVENDIYGGSRLDILKRMALFCKAAVEVPWHVPCGGVCYGDGNLVFIANDWHTALLPVYLKAYYRDHGLMKYTRSVLVIHNIAHQGRGPVEDFKVVDLPGHYLDLFRLYDPVGGEHFNIFAAGLKAADRIVTVSHGYSWEVKTLEGGWGLHNIINENDWKFKGIVNGIDYKEWSPQCDEHLKFDGYTNYSIDSLKTGKARCKEALQKELGLPVRPEVPLIGFIGRLDAQKGVDIIGEAIPWMMGQDVQLVMLGSGRPDLEQMLRNFENHHKDSIRGWVGFSVQMAHRITAGADILLMPSRFEPCGLNQLYAMCYGTIPVVHAVGGLKDTVLPFDPFRETGYGWTFDRAESGLLIQALWNCLLTYREFKKSWEGLQRRGMEQDLSWDNAAQVYEEVLVAAKYHW